MHSPTFGALTRQAGRGISRRASLTVLGASGLAAAIAYPPSSDARKKKRCKKDKKKCPSLQEICAPQVEECKTIVAVACGAGPGCDHLINCCDLFAGCDAGAFVACLGTPAPPVR